jgi:hypothetical protein
MTARKSYQSERDAAPWNAPPVVVNPCGLPPLHHVIEWSPFGRHAGWQATWICRACPANLPDDASASAHLVTSQFVVGYRPAPIAIDLPRGNADDRATA